MPLPRTFQERLRQNRIIPFVGAGLSIGVKSREGNPLFPGWGPLLKRASDRLLTENKQKEARLVAAFVDTDRLYDAAREAKAGLGAANWFDFLKEEFDHVFEEVNSESLRLNQLIWALGSNLVITTNYEPRVAMGLPGPGRLPSVGYRGEGRADRRNPRGQCSTAYGLASSRSNRQRCGYDPYSRRLPETVR